MRVLVAGVKADRLQELRPQLPPDEPAAYEGHGGEQARRRTQQPRVAAISESRRFVAEAGTASAEKMDAALAILRWTFLMEDFGEDLMLDHLLIGEMLRC
jgi:hypothetical protein